MFWTLDPPRGQDIGICTLVVRVVLFVFVSLSFLLRKIFIGVGLGKGLRTTAVKTTKTKKVRSNSVAPRVEWLALFLMTG